MRLTSVTITNLAAFADYTTPLPQVAIIEGPHGAGKSSLENVIKYALGRRALATNSRGVEHDPSILHGNAEKGEAILTFDDEALESLRVVVKKDSTERQTKTKGAKAWKAAGSLLDEITSALAYDPMQFKYLDPKSRLEAFLRVVPVSVTEAEIKSAVGGVIATQPFTPGLDVINALYDDIFAARRTENVAADTQAKHATALEAALPPAAPGDDWEAEATRLTGDLEVLLTSERDELARIGRELQGKKDVHAADRERQTIAINTELDSRVALLQQEIADLKTVAEKSKSVLLQDAAAADEAARVQANLDGKEIQAANAPQKEKLKADIVTAQERVRATVQAEGTRLAAGKAREEAATRKASADSMTAALDRLKNLKSEVAGRMSIKGVTIASSREGLPVDICREENGALVGFESWNSADQDTFCLRMAVLHRGACGLVCIDNMGNWTVERQKAVIEQCKKYAVSDGMQFIIGRATEGGELRVVAA